jgi:hypothetical protein
VYVRLSLAGRSVKYHSTQNTEFYRPFFEIAPAHVDRRADRARAGTQLAARYGSTLLPLLDNGHVSVIVHAIRRDASPRRTHEARRAARRIASRNGVLCACRLGEL